MKIYIILVLTFLISSCSSFDLNRVAPGYVEAYKTLKVYLMGNEERVITAEIIERIPYASLLIKIGNGPEGLMILESIVDTNSIWVSADDIYLLKRNGKVVQTKGLPNNLDEILYSVDFSNLLKVDTEQIYTYYASFSEPKINNLKLKAKFFIHDKKLFDLLRKKISLTLIEEHITSEDLGWEFINKYWVDDNAYVWKSEQFISPKIPKLFIEITKKPSG